MIPTRSPGFVTDLDGRVSFRWVLGQTEGTQLVTLSIGDGEFLARAIARVPRLLSEEVPARFLGGDVFEDVVGSAIVAGGGEDGTRRGRWRQEEQGTR